MDAHAKLSPICGRDPRFYRGTGLKPPSNKRVATHINKVFNRLQRQQQHEGRHGVEQDDGHQERHWNSHAPVNSHTSNSHASVNTVAYYWNSHASVNTVTHHWNSHASVNTATHHWNSHNTETVMHKWTQSHITETVTHITETVTHTTETVTHHWTQASMKMEQQNTAPTPQQWTWTSQWRFQQ